MKRAYVLIINAEVDVRIVINGFTIFLKYTKYVYDGWTGSNGCVKYILNVKV